MTRIQTDMVFNRNILAQSFKPSCFLYMHSWCMEKYYHYISRRLVTNFLKCGFPDSVLQQASCCSRPLEGLENSVEGPVLPVTLQHHQAVVVLLWALTTIISPVLHKLRRGRTERPTGKSVAKGTLHKSKKSPRK